MSTSSSTLTLTIVGRSSSHFTRVARIFAIELGVAHAFRPVLNIAALDAKAYADNPALKIPILIDEHGRSLFGTENICRDIVRRASVASAAQTKKIILRGDVLDERHLVPNAEELVLHVMSSEVTLILAKITGASPPPPKVMRSIENSLSFLDTNIGAVLEVLPADRALSFVEVALYCVVTHLPFREVLDASRYTHLSSFCERFEREHESAAKQTTYRFDAA